MTVKNSWQFSSPLQVIKQRAFLYEQVRQFFSQRGVTEVETPVLSQFGNTDLQIDVFSSQPINRVSEKSYLRTSPEFFHKRLLASGFGDIFEIAKVFRYGESTPLHNPEFSLLEWYRLDFDLSQLMDEVIELIQSLRKLFKRSPMVVEKLSYEALFVSKLGFNPFLVSEKQLNQIAIDAGYHGSMLNRSEALDFMFAVRLEPLLDAEQGYLIYDFPIEQAALAQRHPEREDRCLRFEFLWGRMELANGYQELTDDHEQQLRFEQDNMNRLRLNKPEIPIDRYLIEALSQGLPSCSGVAIGLDRLLMCLLEKENINEVLGFSAKNS